MEKIRILWIDDRHQVGGLPENRLPKNFQPYFEIVDPRPKLKQGESYEADYHFSSAAEFALELKKFWYGESELLPCEIIATDYDLSKPDLGTDLYTTADLSDDEFGGPRNQIKIVGKTEEQPGVQTRTMATPSETPVNFDGLIIGTIYSCITHEHPSALVSMTALMHEMPYGVKTLHKMAEPFVGVSFEKNIGGLERSWENVIRAALPHLRTRIENLYESHKITIHPSDLMALANSADHGVLSVHSPHVQKARKYPIQGLFMDIAEEKREEAINKWAEDLMRTVMVDCEELRQAQELATKVWDTYTYKTNDHYDLVEDRKNLSLLTVKMESGKDYSKTEYEILSHKLGVVNKKCKNSVDITSGNYSDRVRRWATLFITRNLLKLVIQVKMRVEKQIQEATEQIINNPESPVMDENDLYLALFPVPSSPLVIPWHEGKNIDKASGWAKSMLRWKHKEENGENIVSLSLFVPDLLRGEEWSHSGPHGITPSERLVLRGFALEDKDLKELNWRSYNKALLVLWGKEMEI